MSTREIKVKVSKKGERKTPSELKEETRRATIQFVRVFVRSEPDEARKIFREMLDCSV